MSSLSTLLVLPILWGAAAPETPVQTLPNFTWKHKVVWVDGAPEFRSPMSLQGGAYLVTPLVAAGKGPWWLGGSAEGEVFVWDAKTGELEIRFAGHLDGILNVVSLPDSNLILSASHDGTMRLWDLAQRRSVRTVEGGSATVAVDSQGKQFAVGTMGSINLGNTTSWRFHGQIADQPMPEAGSGRDFYDTGAVIEHPLAFSRDGSLLLSGVSDSVADQYLLRRLRVWSLKDGRLIKEFLTGRKPLVAGAFNEDSTEILIQKEKEKVEVYRTSDGKFLRKVKP